MTNWCICWFPSIFLLGILIFRGLTGRRFYKSFGVKWLKKKRTVQRRWKSQPYTSREVYSGSSLLTDLNFQAVSVLYKNFTRVSTSELEFLVHLIGEKIAKKYTAFRKAISIQESLALTLRFLASGDSYVSLQYLSKISHFLPCILLFNFVKMHFVFWVPI
jgi:hypothetical protein